MHISTTNKEFSTVQFISHIPFTHCTHVCPVHPQCLCNLDTLSYNDNEVVLINTFFIHLFTILQFINIIRIINNYILPTYRNRKDDTRKDSFTLETPAIEDIKFVHSKL